MTKRSTSRAALEGEQELLIDDDGQDDYIFELTDGEEGMAEKDGEIQIAVNDEAAEKTPADILHMPEVGAAQTLAAEDAAAEEAPAENPEEAPAQTAPSPTDPVAALAAEAAAALSEEPPLDAHGEGTLLSDNTSVLRAVEAGNDEAIRQVADIAEEEFPGAEPESAEVQEYAGDMPEIEFADAGAGPELAFEEAEPEPMTEDTEGPAAKKHAPDPYETQMLEAILAELESRD